MQTLAIIDGSLYRKSVFVCTWCEEKTFMCNRWKVEKSWTQSIELMIIDTCEELSRILAYKENGQLRLVPTIPVYLTLLSE